MIPSIRIGTPHRPEGGKAYTFSRIRRIGEPCRLVVVEVFHAILRPGDLSLGEVYYPGGDVCLAGGEGETFDHGRQAEKRPVEVIDLPFQFLRLAVGRIDVAVEAGPSAHVVVVQDAPCRLHGLVKGGSAVGG